MKITYQRTDDSVLLTFSDGETKVRLVVDRMAFPIEFVRKYHQNWQSEGFLPSQMFPDNLISWTEKRLTIRVMQLIRNTFDFNHCLTVGFPMDQTSLQEVFREMVEDWKDE